ncbi:lysophospholipid acyltransferase family protein [Chitinimonas arctica]|uniref:Lysophospholipid acyltransferase family protein n=1 Tax=Chitinimonas arctica TaxID=2594795 RepID=A0A516SG26_9NEIS|nr:lysophospholipid acyltransferase family protein [Chitinimonas arctica]QDQ27115.1 lysophospholipid acyltransferase family protein [Chitinimonas arctica]
MLTLLLKLLARCPLFLLHAAGSLAGVLVWLLDGNYRRRLADNLRQANLPDYTYLLADSISQHGKGALELLLAWGRPADAVSRLVRQCEGWQHVEAAIAAQQSILFVTPHLGGFDIAGRYVSSRLPYPLTAMYRPPKLKWLEPLMQAGRERDNGRTAPATAAGVRILMKALKSREATVILPDQAPGAGDGVWASFFGKPAYTMTLLPRLAHATHAAVLFFFAERLSWGRGYRVHIFPMQGSFDGDRQRDAETLNRNVEALIRLAPAQYLWSYNRYKQPAGAPPAQQVPA